MRHGPAEVPCRGDDERQGELGVKESQRAGSWRPSRICQIGERVLDGGRAKMSMGKRHVQGTARNSL